MVSEEHESKQEAWFSLCKDLEEKLQISNIALKEQELSFEKQLALKMRLFDQLELRILKLQKNQTQQNLKS